MSKEKKKSPSKGEVGYIDYNKKIRLILIICTVVIIAAIFITGLIINNTRNNICTVIAILLVLPLGKQLATYLVMVKHKSTDRQFADKVKSFNFEYDRLFDGIVTSKQKVMKVDAFVVGPDFVCAYSPDKKIDKKHFEEFLVEFIKNGKCKVTVSLIQDEKVFLNRLKQFENKNEELDDYAKETISMVVASVKSACI